MLMDVIDVVGKHSPGIQLAPWGLYEAKFRQIYQRWIMPINIPWLPDRILDRRFEDRFVGFFRWIYGRIS